MRAELRRRALGAALCAALTSAPLHAWAFVCSRVATSTDVEGGPSLSWAPRSVVFTLHQAGTKDIAGAVELDVLRAAFDVWEVLSVPGACSASGSTDFSFSEASTLGTLDRVGYDFLDPAASENLLIFRDDEWPMPGQANSTIALTTTTYNAVSGEVLDADIEFNSAGFTFTAGDTGVRADLANTAVHEIGHLLGLAHSSDAESTMYASAPDGETKKRDLACDDKRGIVFKYPSAVANGYCDPPQASCGMCAPPSRLAALPTIKVTDAEAESTGGCSQTYAAPLALVAAALLFTTRRRRPW